MNHTDFNELKRAVGNEMKRDVNELTVGQVWMKMLSELSNNAYNKVRGTDADSSLNEDNLVRLQKVLQPDL